VTLFTLSWGFVLQSRRWTDFPFSQTDLSHSFCDGYAELGIADHDGNADLDLGDLSVEVPRHEALPQYFHAVHLCLGTTSAVVSAPVLPDRASQLFWCRQGLIARDGARRGRCISAGWGDGMGASICNGIVAIARVVCTVGGYAADLLVRQYLAQKVGQYRRIADVVSGNHDRPGLKLLFVDSRVDLALDAPFWPAMLARVPLAFDAGAVD
jgi:hypothetical protein